MSSNSYPSQQASSSRASATNASQNHHHQHTTHESLIQSYFRPNILLCPSPSLQHQLSKSCLTLKTLLMPFETNYNMYLRTLGTSYMVQEWAVRFVEMDDLRCSNEEFESYLHNLLLRYDDLASPQQQEHHDTQRNLPEGQQQQEEESTNNASGSTTHSKAPLKQLVPAFREDHTNDVFTPSGVYIPPDESTYAYTKQFKTLRDEFINNAIDISDFSTMKHPVGIIFAISSSDSVDEFIKMERRVQQVLGNQFNVDTRVLKMHAVFHDVSDSDPKANPNAVYESTKRRFTDTHKFVQFNTRNVDSEPPVDDIWTPCMSKYEQFVRDNEEIQTPIKPQKGPFLARFGPGRRNQTSSQDGQKSSDEENTPRIGELFSLRDIQNFENLIHDFVRSTTKSVFTEMLQKIEHIHTNVAGKYGGRLKNIAKYFGFGSSRKKSVEDSSFGVDSAELQIIRLADYMFMFQDYHGALQNYLKLRDDLKSHKKLYASINEFIGLSMLMYSGASREAEASFSTAFDTYMETGEFKLAMRAALFRSLLFELREQNQFAAESYITASQIFNDDFYRAVLYEQSALCYRTSTPAPLWRKCVFYNSCATFNYGAVGAMNCAYRCQKAALDFQERHCPALWSNVQHLMKLTMARLEMQEGHVKQALKHYHQCFAEPISNVASESDQLTLFEEYKQAVQQFSQQEKSSSGDTESDSTALQPHMFEDLKIPHVINNKVSIFLSTYGEWDAIDHQFDERWRDMEEELLHSIHKRITFSRYDQGRDSTCGVGRPIQFEVSLSNPLLIPLDITGLSPVWTFTPSKKDSSDAQHNSDSETNDITTHPISLQLPPLSQKSIILNMVAHRKGTLVIRGVKWSLGGFASGHVRFALRGKRLNTTKAQRCSVEYEKDRRLHVNIVDPIPRISLSHKDLPSSLLNGQIVRRVVSIRNEGTVPLKNLCVKCNLPQIVSFGTSQDDLPSESVNDDGEQTSIKQIDLSTTEKSHTGSQHRNLSIYAIDLGDSQELAPSESVDLVLFIRGSACGTYDLRLLFAFEPAQAHKYVQYRLHQLRQKISVNPSLLLHTYTQPSVEDVSKYSLTLTVSNSTSNRVMNINQVTCYSRDWILKPLRQSTITEHGSCKVNPNEGAVLHFSIQKAVEQESGDAHSLTQTTISTSFPDDQKPVSVSDCFGTVYWDLLKRNILDSSARKYTSNISSTFDSGNLSLLVLYSSEENDQTAVQGQLDIPHLTFQPSQVKSSGPSCPLQIVVDYDQETEFNSSSGMHLLPVTIHIMNDASSSAVSSCVIEMLHDEKSTTTDYIWMGSNKRKFDIKPGQTVSFFTQAGFFRPGVYNLNRFRVQWLPKKYVGFEHHQFLCCVKDQKEE